MPFFSCAHCARDNRVGLNAIWALLIWTVALLGWILLLKLEGRPAWVQTGGAVTVIGGLLVVARQLVPDSTTAIASWLILGIGLMIPVVFNGVAALQELPENALIAPIFMFLPATTPGKQPASVYLISSGIGAFAFGLASIL